MNIIYLLLELHNKIHDDLAEIDENFCKADLLFRIRKHIMHFRLIETVENSFFFKIDGGLNDADKNKYVEICKRGNVAVWMLFEQLSEALSSNDMLSIRTAFLNLRIYEEQHVENSIRTYFPAILDAINDDALQETDHDFSEMNQLDPVEVP